MHRTWADVSLTALRHNYRQLRTRVGSGVAIMAVVKADAYGHGVSEVARTLATEGAAWFGVSGTAEGVELRATGVTQPILLLSGFLPGDEPALVEHSLTPMAFDAAQVESLESRGIAYHLKIDTGMGRLGFSREALNSIAKSKLKMLDGVSTHFASAGKPAPQNDEQLNRFRAAQAALAAAGIRPRWIHASNSAAVASRRDCWGNLIRPGLALYGYLDCPDALGLHLGLELVLALRTRILSVKEFPTGSPLGYNGSYVTTRRERIAAAGAGYADGVNRALSNRGHALVHGHRVPIVGRVNMDMTLLDVTDVPATQSGDVATFIGSDGEQRITAPGVAEQAQTSSYEILCHVGKRVPRVYA